MTSFTEQRRGVAKVEQRMALVDALETHLAAARATAANLLTALVRKLLEGGTIDRRNRVIKNHGQKFTLRLLKQLGNRQTITLMCHCEEDDMRCHRHILQKFLKRKI